MSFTMGVDKGTIDPPAEKEGVRLFVPAGIGKPKIESPETAAEILGFHLYGLDREACFVTYVDTKHQVLNTEMISLGSIDHTFMDPRGVFRGALIENAAAVVIGHNHPSGDPEPSQDDKMITRRLVKAGELIGIEVLDHIIFGGERWVSLARRRIV